jgi:hypothetical protein
MTIMNYYLRKNRYMAFRDMNYIRRDSIRYALDVDIVQVSQFNLCREFVLRRIKSDEQLHQNSFVFGMMISNREKDELKGVCYIMEESWSGKWAVINRKNTS